MKGVGRFACIPLALAAVVYVALNIEWWQVEIVGAILLGFLAILIVLMGVRIPMKGLWPWSIKRLMVRRARRQVVDLKLGTLARTVMTAPPW